MAFQPQADLGNNRFRILHIRSGVAADGALEWCKLFFLGQYIYLREDRGDCVCVRFARSGQNAELPSDCGRVEQLLVQRYALQRDFHTNRRVQALHGNSDELWRHTGLF